MRGQDGGDGHVKELGILNIKKEDVLSSAVTADLSQPEAEQKVSHENKRNQTV